MRSSHKLLKAPAAIACALFLLLTGPPVRASANASPAQTGNVQPCSAPEYRQFDFWVGEWDVFEIDGQTPVAHVNVDSILDGCVLREQYSGADGHKGQSFTIYDTTRKLWHQTWVTNRGELLVIEGGRQANGIVLTGADRTAQGTDRRVRGEWRPVKGGVQETAVRSLDGGKTWQPWFDLMFRPAANIGKGDKNSAKGKEQFNHSNP